MPAGFVVVDPLTLADPVLFPREHVRAMGALAPGAAVDGTLDLRLGASLGSLFVQFDEVAELARSGRGRRGGEMAHAEAICVAVVRREELLARVTGRSLPDR